MNLLIIPSPESNLFRNIINVVNRLIYGPTVYLTTDDLIFIEPVKGVVEPSAPPICEREDEIMY